MYIPNFQLRTIVNGRIRITLPVAHYLIKPLKAQFIAAYPRSGSTWLRTMLVNILTPTADSNPDVFNRVIPGVSLTRVLTAYKAPQPRLLSTHSVYRPSIKRAVYLIRDGRNCITSLYRYSVIRRYVNISFSEWFDYYVKGVYGPRWDENIESWFDNKILGDNLQVVRYEDFVSNTDRELEKVCKFLDIPYETQDLVHAIDASSIQKMRKWEHKTFGEVTDPKKSFYGGGKENDWDDLLTKEEKKLFLKLSERALTLGGYI